MAVRTHPIKNKDSWEAALLPGFLCFILDTSWVKSREIMIEILFFPSSEKLSFALPLMSGQSSLHFRYPFGDWPPPPHTPTPDPGLPKGTSRILLEDAHLGLRIRLRFLGLRIRQGEELNKNPTNLTPLE